MAKSLAQIGYEAYNLARGGLTYDGKPIPPWEALPGMPNGREVQEAWHCAARSIEATVKLRPPYDRNFRHASEEETAEQPLPGNRPGNRP